MAGRDGGERKTWLDNPFAAGAVFLALLVVAIWFAYRPILILPLFALDWLQLKAVDLLFGLNQLGVQTLDFIEASLTYRLDPVTISFQELSEVSRVVGFATRNGMAVLGFGLIGAIYWYGPGDGLTRRFSITGQGPSFIAYQARKFGALAPMVDYDPTKAPKRERPARRIWEWLQEEKVKVSDGVLDPASATKAFSRQLGPKRKSITTAPLQVKLIGILCALNATWAKDKAETRHEIGRIMASFRGANPKKAAEIRGELGKIADRYLADPKMVRMLDRLAAKHAYWYPACCAYLEFAWDKGGVLASAEFRWLKMVDRELWYALNGLGRRTWTVESLGVMAHYLTEKVTGQPLATPYVKPAMETVEKFLARHQLRDNDDLAHLQRKIDGGAALEIEDLQKA